jgi:hypothetical protein
VRTDAIDLLIGSTSLRVLCDDPVGTATLRSALADQLVAEPSPVGFALRAPTDSQGFHVLLDRSGYVLARVRSIDECLAVLSSHLEAFLPPPPDTVRMRARAVLRSDGGVALVAPPLMVGVAMVERRLQRASLRVIDRLVVDLGADATLLATAPPWTSFGAPRGAAGHAPAPRGGARVEKVVVPQLQYEELSRADVVAFLASVASGLPHVDRLALADCLTSTRVVVTPVGDMGAAYAALEQ